MPALVSDLALILAVAGLVTLLFKRLRQPAVLGYIVAGFLAGPHLHFTPTVKDTASIDTWATIGVIFLMFSLGLEFSLKKVLKMGFRPVMSAGLVMFCMISVGSAAGYLFGWGPMDRLFLGGMLAMSSTTIIYKAFGDLGLSQQRFAGEVMSVLILEDILGVLLMVMLSTVAVSRSMEGAALAASLVKLGFFLILWFVVGLYVVPLFLRRTGRLLSGETLLIVSVGLCFALVMIAGRAGYSAAFGAFMMGSILAETVEAEAIGSAVSPLKDLFGAIFFVSVGMMVDPAVLRDYWLPVCVIVLAVLLGQMLLGTFAFVLSGHPLKRAMRCGFSLAQIGEFAFIIAALGQDLGVTGKFLYPTVVAVSVITTFLTPYMIRAAEPAYDLIERRLPRVVHGGLMRGREPAAAARPSDAGSLARALALQVGVYLTLAAAVILLSLSTLLPLCRSLLGHWPGNAVTGLLALAVASPFLRAIVMRKNHSDEFRRLAGRGLAARLALALTLAARFAVAAAAVYYVLDFLSPLAWPVHVAAAAAAVLLMAGSRRVKMVSIRMERTFMQNLRRREIAARSRLGAGTGYAGRLVSRDLHLARLPLPAGSRWAGKSLQELGFGQSDGVLVAAIVRENARRNIPDGRVRIFPGDHLELIGDDESLHAFARRMQAETDPLPAEGPLMLRRITLKAGSPLLGLTLGESGIRRDFRCMAVGVERGDGPIAVATAGLRFTRGDVLWAVGEADGLGRLMRACGPEGAYSK